MSSLDVLTTEHQLITQMVDALAAMTVRLREGGDAPARLLTRLVSALCHFVEQVHMAKEERVVFPYLDAHGLSRSTAVVAALSDQHESVRVHGRLMRDACRDLARGDAAAGLALVAAVALFLEVFREHMRIEEQYFYALADEVVEPADRTRILEQFREIDRLADAGGARAHAQRVLDECRALA